jgi:hypothetical protein
MLVMIIPLYQAELAHPSIRGRVTSLQQFMLGIGAFIASWAAFGCYTPLTGIRIAGSGEFHWEFKCCQPCSSLL